MRPELIGNPRRQILHGGVISAVLDVAAGFAIHLAVSKSREEHVRATTFPVDRHDRPARRLSAAGARQVFHRHRPRGAARQPRRGRAHGAGERRGRADRDGRRGVYGGVSGPRPRAARQAVVRADRRGTRSRVADLSSSAPSALASVSRKRRECGLRALSSVRQILRHRLPLAVLDLAQHRAVGAEVLGRRELLLVAAEQVRRNVSGSPAPCERVRIEVLAGLLRRLDEQVDDLLAVGREHGRVLVELALVAREPRRAPSRTGRPRRGSSCVQVE